MADWESIRRYADTGTLGFPAAAPGLNTTTFLNANPGIGTQTLQAGQAQYPQQTVFGRALARRRNGGGAPPPNVQTGSTTQPLSSPPPTPFTPNPANVGPEPDRLPPPREETFRGTLTRQLRAIDDRAAVIPTPGDLGPWLLALAFLLVAVVPFNGFTRLQLLWMALTGAARVPNYLPIAGIGGLAGGGGSGTTGGGGSGSIAQGNKPGGTPPPPKQEAPGGFTPRSVVGGGL